MKLDKYPQKDFFIADLFESTPFKDDMATMVYPFFSLSKKKDMRIIEYKTEKASIRISPSEHGLPTIFDKDVMLYAGSILMQEFNKGNIPPRTIHTTTYDLLVATNRYTNSHGYKQLESALKRLSGALITTDIKTNNKRRKKGFHILESYEFLESHWSKNRRVGLEITVSDWFYDSIAGKEVLTINPEYFHLTKPTERRLYEMARKYCGNQDYTKPLKLETVKERVGSTGTTRKFLFNLKAIVEENDLPDYEMHLDGKNRLTFTNRRNKKLEKSKFDLDKLPRMKTETLERAKQLVIDAGTRWDIYAIREQFAEHMIKNGNPENIDGAFIGFVKKKIQNSP